MYHTSFGAGIFISDIDTTHVPNEGLGLVRVLLEQAVGNEILLKKAGARMAFPEELLSSSGCQECKVSLQGVFGENFPYSVVLRLPVSATECFMLFSREMPDTDLPLDIMFEPVLANFGKILTLCRENENHTRKLEEEVSSRKLLEASLIKSRNLMQDVLDTVPARIFWKDTDCRYLGCNSLFVADAGFSSPDEIIGKTDAQMPWGPKEAHLYNEDDRRVMSTREPLIKFEEPQTQSDGKVIWLQTSKIPLIDQFGHVYGVLGSYEDITQRKEAEHEIIVSREEAIRASKHKSEFLSRVSHELRTPLNAIMGFSQLVQLDEELSAENRASIEEIYNAGSHLLLLINEILDLSKVESGRMELKMENVPSGELLDECMSLISPMAQQQGIRIIVPPEADHRLIWADRVRAKQVLTNLLTNAVKYNSPKGEVRVEVEVVDKGGVRISVHDTGPGIPEEKFAGLFETFNRLGQDSDNVEGTGIGLVITKVLMEQMHGRIGYESTVGVGSTFWVLFPRKVEQIESTDSAPELQVCY